MKTLHSINAVAKKQFGSHKHASLVIYGSVLFLAPQLGSGGGKEWANAMQKCHLIPLVLYLPKLWDATLKSLFRIFKTKRKSAVGSIIMYLACLPDSDSVNGATGISKLVHRTFWALCSGGVKSVKPRKKKANFCSDNKVVAKCYSLVKSRTHLSSTSFSNSVVAEVIPSPPPALLWLCRQCVLFRKCWQPMQQQCLVLEVQAKPGWGQEVAGSISLFLWR